MNLFTPPVNVEARADADLVAEARSAREAWEAAVGGSAPSRWPEAECYHELSRRGWSLRGIADACGTNKDSVSVMVRMVSTYVDKESRPSFWTAYSETRADTKAVHVSQNTGQPEWYTPREYIEAARAVLGAIDLDPASSRKAQEIVRARRFYTAEDDSLSRHWEGRVWLNPPYSIEKVGLFTAKLCQHFAAGDVRAALVLVNNATETRWFQNTAELASAICLPARRLRFLDESGNPSGAPLQGQVILYFGADKVRFGEAFSHFGLTRAWNEIALETPTTSRS
jgi:ParB family chromosome partitioning protein